MQLIEEFKDTPQLNIKKYYDTITAFKEEYKDKLDIRIGLECGYYSPANSLYLEELKKYDINQVAHILIINMLRSCMQLDKIAYIIQYINGRVDDRSDDIIADSVLYDYICRILDALTEKVNAIDSIKDTVKEITSDYEEKIEGARERLDSALEIIVIAYYASLVKRHADELLTQI